MQRHLVKLKGNSNIKAVSKTTQKLWTNEKQPKLPKEKIIGVNSEKIKKNYTEVNTIDDIFKHLQREKIEVENNDDKQIMT